MREPPVYARIPVHACTGRTTVRACACGLRRLTIRDAGIHGRGVHADCRNGASDATDKMISRFFFFSPLHGSNCEVSIMRGRWHRKHTRGFGGGMPGSAAMISIARVERRGSLSRGGKPLGAISESRELIPVVAPTVSRRTRS